MVHTVKSDVCAAATHLESRDLIESTPIKRGRPCPTTTTTTTLTSISTCG
jgi:hypothetical protein